MGGQKIIPRNWGVSAQNFLLNKFMKTKLNLGDCRKKEASPFVDICGQDGGSPSKQKREKNLRLVVIGGREKFVIGCDWGGCD